LVANLESFVVLRTNWQNCADVLTLSKILSHTNSVQDKRKHRVKTF